ncbi:12598_t:CDS:2, partial [Cetraspora pellucida]
AKVEIKVHTKDTTTKAKPEPKVVAPLSYIFEKYLKINKSPINAKQPDVLDESDTQVPYIPIVMKYVIESEGTIDNDLYMIVIKAI